MRVCCRGFRVIPAQRFFENPFAGWTSPSPQKLTLQQANAALQGSPQVPQAQNSARTVSVWAMLDQAKVRGNQNLFLAHNCSLVFRPRTRKGTHNLLVFAQVELDTAQRELLAARKERASKVRDGPLKLVAPTRQCRPPSRARFLFVNLCSLGMPDLRKSPSLSLSASRTASVLIHSFLTALPHAGPTRNLRCASSP